MKVILHGATNLSNYGDYLFAELYYHALRQNNVHVEFYCHPKYGISDYFSRYLNYKPSRNKYMLNVKECDAFVYIPGGYFIEPKRRTLLENVKRINRYLTPGLMCIKCKKPVYVIGVGAGPFENSLFSKKAKKILNYATTVSVRNEESKIQCNNYGISRDIIVTADSVLCLPKYLNDVKKDVPKFSIPEEKMLLLHIGTSEDVYRKIREKIAPAIKQFLKANQGYKLYLTADYVVGKDHYEKYEKIFEDCSPTTLIYDDPWVLTRQIECADLIVTTKLHVGIVGCVLGRSVVSFANVPNKTKRFYNQIGECNRCASLDEIDSNEAYNMLEQFKDRLVCIPKELIEKAEMNFALLPK